MKNKRIVITGVGLTSPNGNNLAEFRKNLLEGKSGVTLYKEKLMGEVIAGVCVYDESKYQSKKERRRGTRAASIGIYCAHEALKDAGINLAVLDKSNIGIYVGITEHGAAEATEEIMAIKDYGYNLKYVSHLFNPKTISNNPAGEIALNLGITGPHYTLGAACAAGNIGLIHGAQMLMLDEVDLAICGGVSESIRTFLCFASFRNEGALANNNDPQKACRPFDTDRNGIVISEGGCLYILERLDDALARKAKIYGELVGYGINTDASDYVAPNQERQEQCMVKALRRAVLEPQDISIINAHSTSTPLGDKTEGRAIYNIFGKHNSVYITNTKSYIGHTMGAAGALELAGELPSFTDGFIHHTLNLDNLDAECMITNIVRNEPIKLDGIRYILNNSFGMLGINSTVIIKKYE
ncbi:MAG: beta-ketoacyl-[acyl-carrier-protein] synthase family protein [Nitrospirae bacterium]|nr:beta-ketoacyl-[acyl-carrier-protein] synthase family protein [Nitrospirota bacterium]MBF0536271.1 beta-ketoacyl-[acyl-carrier-protein] synthase family protein [Nitrospirota bacterium]MBF0615795.1 beta-ketoacyl-[acyl-carrier-protein] synthase family protein [Nitrospirota bacterium]